jgi:hypothetical protein
VAGGAVSYRICAECNDEFKALRANPGEDEELTYKLERCIYVFFMSGSLNSGAQQSALLACDGAKTLSATVGRFCDSARL